MAYANWDLKPRIHKAYQSGTDLIIEGVHLDRWSGNIANIELFFEYYSYFGTPTVGSGYMLGWTPSSDLIPTREIVHTITAPTPVISGGGTIATIPLGLDISNFTKTFTDTFSWYGGGIKHALLHAKLTWTGLSVLDDGASAYSVLFNCWREIDTQYSWVTHKTKRNVRWVIQGGGDLPFDQHYHLVYIDLAPANNRRAIICDVISNTGTSTRQYINRITNLDGYSGQIGYGYASNANLANTSVIQSRFYAGLAQVGANEWVVGLDASMPTYILAEEGVETQLALPLPVISNAYYDRGISRYVIQGTGLDNRPIVAFGWERKNASSEQYKSNFSNPVINLVTPTRIEISMGAIDLYDGSYASKFPPMENSLLTMWIGFLGQSSSSDSSVFVVNSIDGSILTHFNAYRNPSPTAPNFGEIDPRVMNGTTIEYNPSTWGDGTGQMITLWIDPVAKPNTVSFMSLESGTYASYSKYTWATPWYKYQYEIVNINGVDFGKVQLVMPLDNYASNNKVGAFIIRMTGVGGTFVVNVNPAISQREITFDVPFVVLGDNGYYSTGESLLRGDKATLLVRAVDVLGVLEHPPTSPFNNTVRISDAPNGWNGQVMVEVVGDDGITIHPFTTFFLTGGQNGADYSYEASRIEISLNPSVNIWNGRLRFSIPTPFVLNFIEYSGVGVSIPITLTRQNSLLVPLETADPNSCIRGQIDGNQGLRGVNFRAYVPEYLKESPFENFVGVFQDEMNTLYTGSTASDPYAMAHGILDKIDGLLDMHDPDTIPSQYLHMLAKNLGYDMVSGILRARDIANAPDDLLRYARFLVANLPEINRIKATKDAIRGLMFSVGALADIYYKWTSDYGLNYDENFILRPTPERAWSESNENRLYEAKTVIETRQIKDESMGLTPHFSIDVDLSQFDLYSQTEGISDILGRVLNTINALRPINTVLDDLSLVINVEHDVKQLPTMVDWWGDGVHSQTDTPEPIVLDSIDEGRGVLGSPWIDTIDEKGGILPSPLPDSIESPSGLI
jgi:hypothetical protein